MSQLTVKKFACLTLKCRSNKIEEHITHLLETIDFLEIEVSIFCTILILNTNFLLIAFFRIHF